MLNVAAIGYGTRIGAIIKLMAEKCEVSLTAVTDTGNHDSGSILIQYENGLHAVYTQNFIVRRGGGQEGCKAYRLQRHS